MVLKITIVLKKDNDSTEKDNDSTEEDNESTEKDNDRTEEYNVVLKKITMD